MSVSLLVVVGTPVVCGFAAWLLAEAIDPKYSVKRVRATPSGSPQLDMIRENLARSADIVGIYFEEPRVLDDLARDLAKEPTEDLQRNLREARGALRRLAGPSIIR
ncbi:hypothetical protein [Novosphingobium sp. 9U]|uniref:hypothetical protein n=1 Tax=Novosphingobium sp. 9U TaxID=2653158 RepID=UPI0012F06910|nr:hypothetical protein [Novosphingobium sp. 9U]VWX51070.1 hypothetical protein NOVOSPHI9U_370068 [Novosphingobium sp. 9U]